MRKVKSAADAGAAGRESPTTAALADQADTDLPTVRITGLNKTFVDSNDKKVIAVQDMNLEVNPGEMVVLLGPSGCGKTTLLRCVAGLEQPDSGEIEIHGSLVYSSARKKNMPTQNRALSMMFQSYALWPHMTALENVAYPLRTRGMPRRQAAERVKHALGMVGVSRLIDEYPSTMSGGQQQRVALARALVSGSGLVLFDEPLSNVDAKVREDLRAELLAMQEELRFSALYVTHDQTEALTLGHRIAVLDNGVLVQIASPQDIYHKPKTPYVGRFVGVTNELAGQVAERLLDGRVRIDTELGDVIGMDHGGGLRVGDRVIAMFRPESCLIDADSTGGDHGVNRWEAEFVRAVFTGAYMEVHAKVRGLRLKLWHSSADVPDTPGSVWVSVAPSNVAVLASDDPPTGMG